jgi:hypothetical protein
MTGDRSTEHPTGRDSGLAYALRRLHDDETALTVHLTTMREQHRSEHEIYHAARDLVAWSHDNLAQIVETAAKYQTHLNAQSMDETSRPPDPALAAVDVQPAGLRLLDGLRTTYLLASGTSLSWELLAQYAQARRESDILDLAGRCHPRTLRQIRWANTMLKTQSPQALISL